jgi:hypothetical protein
MPMKAWNSLTSTIKYFHKGFLSEEDLKEEEEEGGEYLFDPEAGKASDDPFAHLNEGDAPDNSAASNDEEVSKYVAGEEE